MADFTVKTLPTGDSAIVPVSIFAHNFVVEYSETFGRESLVSAIGCPQGIFVETSRDASRLTDVVADLRAKGYTFSRVKRV